jgi:hypothetical protein
MRRRHRCGEQHQSKRMKAEQGALRTIVVAELKTTRAPRREMGL